MESIRYDWSDQLRVNTFGSGFYFRGHGFGPFERRQLLLQPSRYIRRHHPPETHLEVDFFVVFPTSRADIDQQRFGVPDGGRDRFNEAFRGVPFRGWSGKIGDGLREDDGLRHGPPATDIKTLVEDSWPKLVHPDVFLDFLDEKLVAAVAFDLCRDEFPAIFDSFHLDGCHDCSLQNWTDPEKKAGKNSRKKKT
jgi:hypothetical protein